MYVACFSVRMLTLFVVVSMETSVRLTVSVFN